MDVESGAVHSIDEMTYDILSKEKLFLEEDGVEKLSEFYPQYPPALAGK